MPTPTLLSISFKRLPHSNGSQFARRLNGSLILAFQEIIDAETRSGNV
jgi:hypothetical protein